MKKEIIRCLIALSFYSAFSNTIQLYAQQNETTKQQVETQLQNYTPAQIREKIKELGLTEQEFQQRAKALGLDAQQYLDILSGKSIEQLQDTTTGLWEEQKEIKSRNRQ